MRWYVTLHLVDKLCLNACFMFLSFFFHCFLLVVNQTGTIYDLLISISIYTMMLLSNSLC